MEPQINTGPVVFTKEMIIAAMDKWRTKIVNDVPYLIKCFKDKYYFPYTKQVAEGSKYIHMYAGIHNTDIYFFAIPDVFDTVEHRHDFERYTQPCKLSVSAVGGGNEIDRAEAQARMDAWKDNYKTWLPKQSKTDDGIFQLFEVDTIDFDSDETLANMALVAELGNPTGFVADLIITNVAQTHALVFEDFSRPIPPMGPSALVSNYYLLTL